MRIALLFLLVMASRQAGECLRTVLAQGGRAATEIFVFYITSDDYTALSVRYVTIARFPELR